VSSPPSSSTLPLTLYTEPSRLRNHVVDTLDAHDTPWSIGYEGAELVGAWGVSLRWNDGHSTGIYAWDVLRAWTEQ